jgi:hypothetical protein
MAYQDNYQAKYQKWKKRARGSYGQKDYLNFQARLKKALMKTAETKMYQIANEDKQLYHNIGFNSGTALVPAVGSSPDFFNVWADIQKGTGRSNRIGDKISPRGMSLKIWLANKRDRPNLYYRVMVLRLPKAITSSLGVTSVTDASTNAIFDQLDFGSNGNRLLQKLDNDKGVKALYDECIQVQDNAAFADANHTREIHHLLKLWIKPKYARDIVFDSTNQTIVNNPIALFIIPYDSYGSLQTDIVASCAWEATLYYKDV